MNSLYRLDAYCIENLVIHEEAAIQIAIEEGAMSAEDAGSKFDFKGWVAGCSNALVTLFAWFAVLNEVSPQEPTEALGIGTIISASRKGKLPSLDRVKLDRLRDQIQARAEQA